MIDSYICPICRNHMNVATQKLSECPSCGTIYHQGCAEQFDNTCPFCKSQLTLFVVRVNRKLRVFLCHSSKDKPFVANLYSKLDAETNIEAWLDEIKILPGQDWESEIKQAIRNSDVFIVCLSSNSINKEGYIQKEIFTALNVAEEKPESTIFIIPVRLEECQVPLRLSRWQWVDLFKPDGYIKLTKALKHREKELER